MTTGFIQMVLTMGINQLNFKSEWGTNLLVSLRDTRLSCGDMLSSITEFSSVGKKSIREEPSKRKNPRAVKISPWTLARLNAEEALGLAYQRLGRYTAAIKGVEQFRQALEISSQCVPAQYGLALGLLCLAKDCMNLGAFKWGASLLEEASEVARASAYSVKNVSCRKTLP
ncbi:hypothetical protein AHAS_Ahas07G0070100 [Arachis hypogaea]